MRYVENASFRYLLQERKIIFFRYTWFISTNPFFLQVAKIIANQLKPYMMLNHIAAYATRKKFCPLQQLFGPSARSNNSFDAGSFLGAFHEIEYRTFRYPAMILGKSNFTVSRWIIRGAESFPVRDLVLVGNILSQYFELPLLSRFVKCVTIKRERRGRNSDIKLLIKLEDTARNSSFVNAKEIFLKTKNSRIGLHESRMQVISKIHK